MSRDEKETCGYCRFFSGKVDDIGGTCRRSSPVTRPIVRMENNKPIYSYIADWPTLLADEWCGEFQNRRGDYDENKT
jgi:hypothetical protein